MFPCQNTHVISILCCIASDSSLGLENFFLHDSWPLREAENNYFNHTKSQNIKDAKLQPICITSLFQSIRYCQALLKSKESFTWYCKCLMERIFLSKSKQERAKSWHGMAWIEILTYCWICPILLVGKKKV